MLKFLIFFSVWMCLGCSVNFLEDLSDKNTDDALIFDAKTAVNAQQYDDAIDILTNRLSSSGQQKTEAREVLASAYAGKCGLNFLSYIEGLSEATSGTAFQLAAAPFVGVPVDSDYCLLSLQTLDLVGSTAERTSDQNAFAAVVGMVLMGSATRLYTDNTPVDGDGVTDAPNISCSLTDAQIDNVVLGYGYMNLNFSAIAADIGTTAGSSFTDSIAACESVAGSACEITDPALITSPIRDTMKDLLNTQQYGVGAFDANDPLLIPVACP